MHAMELEADSNLVGDDWEDLKVAAFAIGKEKPRICKHSRAMLAKESLKYLDYKFI